MDPLLTFNNYEHIAPYINKPSPTCHFEANLKYSTMSSINISVFITKKEKLRNVLEILRENNF